MKFATWVDVRGSPQNRAMQACAGLALLPMAGAFIGAAIDERLHQGYSSWLSACRAAGISLPSVLTFTIELLPNAVIGALLAGLAVQLGGMLLRHRACAVRVTLAAHVGCLMGMATGMLLCTLVQPMPLLLVAEAMFCAFAATALSWLMERRAHAASVMARTRVLTSAQ